MLNPLASACRAARSGTRRKLKPFEDIDLLVAAHSYSAANWLAMHAGDTWSSMARPRSSWAGWRSTGRNAGLNPRAAYRDPMTMNDYLSSRPVSTPFGLFDCDVPVDGAIALVVSTPTTPPTARIGRWRWRRSAGHTARAVGFTVTTSRRWHRWKPPPRCGADLTARTFRSPNAATAPYP